MKISSLSDVDEFISSSDLEKCTSLVDPLVNITCSPMDPL